MIKTLLILLPLLALSLAHAAELEIRIVYDNTAAEPGLQADWGFAAAVDWRGRRILFDGGARPEVLKQNLAKLSIPPQSFEALVLSHAHHDHSGGLFQDNFHRPGAPLFLLARFPPALAQSAEASGLNPRRIEGSREIVPGIYTTGTVEGTPPEQALVIETGQGIIVLTGCSHPGVVMMVEAALKQRPAGAVRLLAGGFHMLKESPAAIREAIQRLRSLGVQSIAPTHCTGEQAMAMFREAFGARCLSAGAGKRLTLD
jgi:7,8-dihydropterin-6-yl-methyl-4-(beta-D-ribofuranosyl)aminobenzene 5'-phosphate synthase